MNIYFKRIFICAIIILLLVATNVCFANPFSVYQSNDTSNQQIEDLGEKILGVINVAGTVIAICMLLFVGMKFMLAAPDERAQLKGALVPFIVGAILLFAATGIANLIFKFSEDYVK